jgi:hypothetical protein
MSNAFASLLLKVLRAELEMINPNNEADQVA